MKIKFSTPTGSAHLAEHPMRRDYLVSRQIVSDNTIGWEDDITEKIRHEHKIRILQERLYEAERKDKES